MITNNFHLPLHSFFAMLVLVTDTDTDMKLNIILEEILLLFVLGQFWKTFYHNPVITDTMRIGGLELNPPDWPRVVTGL